MSAAARTLAEFAVGLKYEAIPQSAIERAKTCIIDTVGAMTFGADLPWSRIVIEYVMRTTAPGKGSIVGTKHTARGQLAALANGALAHAFELDSLCHPSVGVHPGASLTAPGIPVSQAQGRSGRELAHGVRGRLRSHVPRRRCRASLEREDRFSRAGPDGRLRRCGRDRPSHEARRRPHDERARHRGIDVFGVARVFEIRRRHGEAAASRTRGGGRRARGDIWRVKVSPAPRPSSKDRSGFSRLSRRRKTRRASRRGSARSGIR